MIGYFRESRKGIIHMNKCISLLTIRDAVQADHLNIYAQLFWSGLYTRLIVL